MEFAPVSTQPSTRLQLVAGYFTVAGGSMLAFVGIGLVVRFTLLRASLAVPALTLGFRMAGALVAALGLLWTGRALREQRRSGWWSALLTLAAPIVTSWASSTWSSAVIGTSVIGLLLLASVREELR
jgi:uncharacterized membrane protein YedE/YeeE